MIDLFVTRGWPEQMSASVAAAYCGENSAESFRRKVRAGIYPAPTLKLAGSRAMWHLTALKAALAKLHRITADDDDLAELV